MSTWFGGRVRKPSLSRATRGSSGKGKPRLASFSAGITSSRVLPTSSAGYWSPSLSCVIQIDKRLRREVILRGRIFARNCRHERRKVSSARPLITKLSQGTDAQPQAYVPTYEVAAQESAWDRWHRSRLARVLRRCRLRRRRLGSAEPWEPSPKSSSAASTAGSKAIHSLRNLASSPAFLMRPSRQHKMLFAARLVVVAGHDDGACVVCGLAVDQPLRIECFGSATAIGHQLGHVP